MKNLLTASFIAMTSFLFSCSNDDLPTRRGAEEIDFQISTSLPKGIPTYASEHGGVTNVDNGQYDLRYICEAWTKDGQLAYREIKTTDDFASTVSFSARLIALNYDFVFWADFVDNNSTTDKHYTTTNPTGLQDIEMKEYQNSNETHDAYFAAVNVDLTNGNVNKYDVKLKRPFGKIRLIASDKVQTGSASGLGIEPKLAVITYPVPELPGGFNALAGTVTGKTVTISENYRAVPAIEDVVVGGIPYNHCYVLSFDYIFATNEMTAISLNVKTYSDENGTNQIGNKDISAIPVERNKLTTVIGNLYTNNGKVDVKVDDAFDGFTNLSDIKNIDEIASILELAYQGDYIGQNVDLVITGQVSGTSNEIIIPDEVNKTNTPSLIFDFKDVVSGSKITIGDENANIPVNNYDGTVEIRVPSSSITNLEINLPNAHVVLIGNFGEIIAKTSPSTLVIPQDSHVDKLNIQGGNIDIKGLVNELKVADSNQETGIIKVFTTGAVSTVGQLNNYKIYWNCTDNTHIITGTSQVVVNPAFTENGTAAFGPDQNYYTVGINAFSTIEAALSAVDTNGKVVVAEGIFSYPGLSGNGALHIRDGITVEGSGESTILKGQIYPKSNVIIKNLRIHQPVYGITPQNGLAYAPLYLVNSDNVIVEGVTFTTDNGGNTSSDGATAVYSNKKLTIRNSTFQTFWKGIFINNNPVQLTGNTFHNMNPISLIARYDGTTVISGNTFSRNEAILKDLQFMDISPANASELVFTSFLNVITGVKSASSEFKSFINSVRADNTWTGTDASKKPIRIRSGEETYTLTQNL